MDFGSNSLWGSFSSEQEKCLESEVTPKGSVSITSVTLTPAAASPKAQAQADALDVSTLSPSSAAESGLHAKWDINDFLGERGDSCSSGKGCKCPECQMSFAFPGILEVHRAKLHGVTPLPSCKGCNMVFRRSMGLINHWRTGVPHVKDRDGLKLLGCDICDSFNIINGFKDKDDIAEHTRAVHGQNVLIDSTNFDKPLCPLCQRSFTYRKGVIEHIQILHGEHLVVDLIGAENVDLQKRLIDELQYRCHYCPKTFRVKKSLLQHLEKFHQDTTGYTQPRPGSPQTTFKAHSVKGNAAAATSSSPPPAPQLVIQPNLPQQPAFASSQAKSPQRNPIVPSKQPSLPTNVLPATCHDCGKSFSRQSILNVHGQMVHGAPSTLNRAVNQASDNAKVKNFVNGFASLQPLPQSQVKNANRQTMATGVEEDEAAIAEEEEDDGDEDEDDEGTVAAEVLEEESMEEDEDPEEAL